jgi:hypothetical protein
VRRLVLAFLTLSLCTSGAILTTSGVAGASGGRPLDEGRFNLSFCVTGNPCGSTTWHLGRGHVMTSGDGGVGTWSYSSVTHQLNVTYSAPGCAVYNGTGTPEKGFSGTLGGCYTGTFTASEPPGT